MPGGRAAASRMAWAAASEAVVCAWRSASSAWVYLSLAAACWSRARSRSWPTWMSWSPRAEISVRPFSMDCSAGLVGAGVAIGRALDF
jgi:hypothetical protein